jgi:hypothetical protein
MVISRGASSRSMLKSKDVDISASSQGDLILRLQSETGAMAVTGVEVKSNEKEG